MAKPPNKRETEALIPFDEALRRLVNTPPKPKPAKGKKPAKRKAAR